MADIVELTKDSAVVLHEMYEDYKSRKKSGASREDARQFMPFFWKAMKGLSDYADDDIRACILELEGKKIVKSDILGNVMLTDEGISFSEHKLKRFIEKAVDTGSKIIPFIR